MSKAKSMINKNPNVKLSKVEINQILTEVSNGITQDVIQKKYNINEWQYNEIVKMHNQKKIKPEKKHNDNSYNSLSKLKNKSGANKQGPNETCLCGSGLKYKNCCSKNKLY